MPLGKKLSRRSSQGNPTPSSDKGSSERRSSLRALRSLSISFPSKENRRLSLSSPKKGNSSQGTCSQPHSNSLVRQSTEGSKKVSTTSAPDEQARNGVSRTIPLKDAPDYLDRSPSPPESPTFKIEEYFSRNHGAAAGEGQSSAPIPMAPSGGGRVHHAGCVVSISDMAESPRRYGLRRSMRVVEEDTTDGQRHSSSSSIESPQFPSPQLLGLRHGSDDNLLVNPPSSPLLMAVKKAVDSLNQYEDFDIIEEIGSGFFADVFKVRHTPTGQLMVLKRNKKKGRVGLLKEVELLKRLSHANILHYVGACIHEGQLHPLTEYISGGTLEDLIRSEHLFPWSLRIRLSLDIAKGMEYLHQHSMLHRDLNSHNVLLRSFGNKYTAVVADFGLAAKSVPAVKKLTRAQSIVGTPFWMAPEVLNGKPYNETADVFSYGIVMCEVISRLSADPDDIPRSKDYGLDRDGFRSLPQVTDDCCPEEFLELAFTTCKITPSDRPLFDEIKTQLYVIRDLHNFQLLSQDSLDCVDDTIQPQPPIRLSIHVERSVSPSYLLDSPTSNSDEFEYNSSGRPRCSSPLYHTNAPNTLSTAKSVETAV